MSHTSFFGILAPALMFVFCFDAVGCFIPTCSFDVDCDVQVRVVPNFSTVNVYWLTTGSPEDQAVETLLKEHEGLLR